MDGLVLDSETTYMQAWQQAAGHMGYELTTAFCLSLSGLTAASVEQRLLNHCGDVFDQLHFRQISTLIWRENVERHGIPVKKGLHNLLALIKHKQLPYCLATNSRYQDALYCLQRAGLADVFPDIISREDVAQAKPAADIFIKAASRLTTPISQCLVLEDSAIGIQAAVAAGAPCLYIPSVHPADGWASLHANAVLADLNGVIHLIHESCRCQSLTSAG